MTQPGNRDPKARILDAGLRLFSQKGYAAVGVREIAKAAQVNISMISYYYDSKVGILKAIMEEFFDRYGEIFGINLGEDMPVEEYVGELVSRIVEFVRTNLDLAMVAYNELPLEVPEIAEMKAERVKRMIAQMQWLLNRLHLETSALEAGIVGPSLVSIIFMQFRIQPMLKRIFAVRIDDDYYREMKKAITALILGGAQRLAAVKASGREQHDE